MNDMTHSPPSTGSSACFKRARETSVCSMNSIHSGERDSPMEDSPSFSGQDTAATDTADSIPPSEQLDFIHRLQEKPLKVNDTCYLVGKAWFNRWEQYCTRMKSTSPSTLRIGRHSRPDKINNATLLESEQLKPNLVKDQDYVVVCEEAWEYLSLWYGTYSYDSRMVIQQGEEIVVEVYPPVFTLYVAALVGQVISRVERPPKVRVSSTDQVQDVLRTALEALDLSGNDETRLWGLQDTPQEKSVHISADRVKTSTLIDTRTAATVEEALANMTCLAVEVKNKQTHQYPSEAAPYQIRGIGTTVAAPTTAAAAPNTPNAKSFPFFFGKSPSPHGLRPTHASYEKGICGLGNLGNTCYMNSALQCLSHTSPLTQWFLAGDYKRDLNPTNPLGMKGEVAEAYGALVHKLWSGSSSSTLPKEFKYTLGRFNATFTGYMQHDSQELIAFLLDGLHEDLNRIQHKPYVELPDFDRMSDQEVAACSWQYHKARNDSIIVDLFQGQFKSRLVCNECHKVSVTFDPFMYLTLPLPIQKRTKIRLVYVPYDPSQRPQRILLTLNKEASIQHLKLQVAQQVKVRDPSTLLVTEVYNNEVYKIFHHYEGLSTMDSSNEAYVYELPESLPSPPKPRTTKRFSLTAHLSDKVACQEKTGEKEKEEDFIVFPVYCAYLPETRESQRRVSLKQFGKPLILGMRRKEAMDPQAIYRLIAEHIERYAVVKLFEECSSPPTMEILHSELEESGQKSTVEEAMEIDMPQKPIHTAAAVTAAGGRRMEPMANMFVMKVPTGEDVEAGDLFSVNMSWDAASFVDLKERTRYRQEKSTKEEAAVNSTEKEEESIIESIHPSTSTAVVEAIPAAASPLPSPMTGPKEKETACPPVQVIRQGEAIVIQWKLSKAQQIFGYSSRYDHGIDQSGWSDVEECEDPVTEKKTTAKTITLADCLDEFTKEEQLGEEDLWFCPSCKKHQQATKKFDLWRMPEILVVHLKRFSHSRTWRDKIDAFIDFPTQGLDLTDRVLDTTVNQATDQDRLLYDLYAVDNHYGGMGGGHYTAYAQNEKDHAWYNFDDSHVSKTGVDKVKTSAAYLLFYKRRRENKPTDVQEDLSMDEEESEAMLEDTLEEMTPTIVSMTLQDTEMNERDSEPAAVVVGDISAEEESILQPCHPTSLSHHNSPMPSTTATETLTMDSDKNTNISTSKHQ
ncbi:hypothetical protein BDF14DRAFT_1770291 [Spinellus fusiger]|nr:hypothetical protein BDF14DRAFT_1770291 [Spinellus fusiger]